MAITNHWVMLDPNKYTFCDSAWAELSIGVNPSWLWITGVALCLIKVRGGAQQNRLLGPGTSAEPYDYFGIPELHSLGQCLPSKTNRDPQATLIAEISHLKVWHLMPWSRHLESESASQSEASNCHWFGWCNLNADWSIPKFLRGMWNGRFWLDDDKPEHFESANLPSSISSR